MAEDEVGSQNGHRPRVWPVFLTYAGVFVGSLILGVFLIIVAVSIDAARNPEASHDPEAVARAAAELAGSPAFLLAASIILYAILIPVPLLAARLGGQRVVVRLRLAPAPRNTLAVLLAIPGLLGLSQVLDSLMALMEWNPGGTIEYLARVIRASTGPTLGLVVFVVGPVAGFAEELFFRGFMQTRLQERWGRWPAILVTAAAFGLLHLDPVHTPLAFAIGLYLGWITELTGSLWPAIAAHIVNNTVSSLSLVLFPAPWPPAVHAWLLVAAALAAVASMEVLRRVYPETDREARTGG